MNPRPLIAHETPLCLMGEMKRYTDYDYALVHLFEDEDKEFARKYYQFFKTSIRLGRRVLLDNSIFELGEAFDMEKFFEWAFKLQPTEYFIPDCLNNRIQTVMNVKTWFQLVGAKAKEGKVLTGKAIGVCQGASIDDIMACYLEIAPYVDKVAISFDSKCFSSLFPDASNWEHAMMYGRWMLVDKLIKAFQSKSLIQKPLHLLGCALPQEFQHYRETNQLSYIDTIDTSNPVVHGILGIKYSKEGTLEEKNKTKLIDFIKMPLSSIPEDKRKLIFLNVLNFKKFLW